MQLEKLVSMKEISTEILSVLEKQKREGGREGRRRDDGGRAACLSFLLP